MILIPCFHALFVVTREDNAEGILYYTMKATGEAVGAREGDSAAEEEYLYLTIVGQCWTICEPKWIPSMTRYQDVRT